MLAPNAVAPADLPGLPKVSQRLTGQSPVPIRAGTISHSNGRVSASVTAMPYHRALGPPEHRSSREEKTLLSSGRSDRSRPQGAPGSGRGAAPAASAQRWLELHAPAGDGPPRWAAAGAWIVIAAAALVLVWVAFRLHVVGDYYTESDFYGGYAGGARLFQRGHPDPSRYAVVGPGYDATLALVGFVARDLFTAARLIAVTSAVGTLMLWRSLLRHRAGAGVALWATAFLAANPLFLRYGYSSTTDMLAMVLQAASLHAMLGSGGRFAPARAGAFAALATLTRYNSIYLVPAGIVSALWLAPPADRARGRALLLQLGGFALVAAPWLLFSLGSGFVPGASLFEKFGSFYMVSGPSRNVQDLLAARADSIAAARELGRAASHGPAALLAQVLRNLPEHLRADARELLGWPAAMACLAGLALAAADGQWKRLMAVWVAGALLFATLVPVFYSDRYSMALAPAYLTLAAAAATSRYFALRIRPARFQLKWLVAVVPLLLSIRGSVAYQQDVQGSLPVEVLEAGRALARVAPPGARVLSRKSQIGYYGNCQTVAFPRLGSLPQLAEYCRRMDVSFLYFSWYEAGLRPEFSYLLDTSATLPGLTALHTTSRNPGVLYRVGPEFGTKPDWMANRAEWRLHISRAMVQVLPDSEAARYRVVLAQDALDRSRNDEALIQATASIRGRPSDPVGWMLAGEALRATHRMSEAARAYEKVLLLDPSNVMARLALGWTQLGTGDVALAGRTWRPAIGPAADPTTLRQMVEIYDRLGDREAAQAARGFLTGSTP